MSSMNLNIKENTIKNIKDVPYILYVISINKDYSEELSSLSDKNANIRILGLHGNRKEDKKFIKKVPQLIIDQKLCLTITDNYINNSLEHASFILVIYNPDTESVLGFATIQEKEEELLLDLICTNNKEYKNIGRLLINILKEIHFILKIPQIILKSVPNALDFYLKMGFELGRKKGNIQLTYNNKKGYIVNTARMYYPKNSEGGRRRITRRRRNTLHRRRRTTRRV